jgi:uncharacterized protein (TIGR02246 family)
MTNFLTIAWLLFVPLIGGGQATPLAELTGEKGDVQAVHTKFSEIWSSHDAAALAAMWTEDGDYTEPDGRTVFGRQEVQRLFGYEHASVFKESKLNLLVERVRMADKGTAIVDGTYELFGARDPRGRPIGMRSGYFTTVLVKQGDKWMVSAARLMLPQVLIWREGH